MKLSDLPKVERLNSTLEGIKSKMTLLARLEEDLKAVKEWSARAREGSVEEGTEPTKPYIEYTGPIVSISATRNYKNGITRDEFVYQLSLTPEVVEAFRHLLEDQADGIRQELRTLGVQP